MGAAMKALATKRAKEKLTKKMQTAGDVSRGDFQKLAQDRLDEKLGRMRALGEETKLLATDPRKFMEDRMEGLLNPKTAIKQQLLKEGFPEDAIDEILGGMFVQKEREEVNGILR